MQGTYKKLIILLLIVSLILRVGSVFTSPVKDWDETVYDNLGHDLSMNLFDYSFANNGWSDFIPGGMYPNAGFRPPLLPYILAVFYFFNMGFFIQFIIPVIGTLAVLLIYLLGKNMFDAKAGLLAAMFLAITPLHIIMSGRIMNDVLSTTLIILSFLIFWKGYENNINYAKVLFGFVFALALLARYTTLWLFPVFLLYFIIRDKSVRFLKDKYLWFAFGAFTLTLTPLLIYGILFYNNPIGAFIHGGISASYWGGQQPAHFFLTTAFNNFSFIALIFLFSLAYIIMKRLYRYKQIYFLLLWVFIFFGFAMLMPHKEDRFILPAAPAIALVAAFYLSRARTKRWITIGVTILVFAHSAIILSISANNNYNNVNINCFLQTTDYLKQQKMPYVTVSENPLMIRYYTRGESAYYPDDLTLDHLKEIEMSHEIPVYFVFTKFNSGFGTEKWMALKDMLRQNYRQVFACRGDPDANFIYSNEI